MLITFTLDNENFSQLEVAADLEIENFLALVYLDNPGFNRDDNNGAVVLFVNGKQWKVDNELLKRKLTDINVSNNDLIAIAKVQPRPPQGGTSRPSMGAAQPGSSGGPNNIANLIRSIKVPTAKAKPAQPQTMKDFVDRMVKNSNPELLKTASRNLFIQMSSPVAQLRFKDEYPSAVAQYVKEPTNYEAFHASFLADQASFHRRLLLTEDPTSPEGQQMIHEMIKREVHKEQLQKAMTEMPEAFIRSHMLYIKMKINGIDTIGFVDSGAQITTISAAHAQKFNLGQKIDKNFATIIRGVGGEQQSDGRIHSADIEVNGHVFPAPLTVLPRFGEDVLIGLDTLRRHGSCIDLAKNCLRLGNQGVEVPFMNEKQYYEECKRLGLRANLPPEEQEPLPDSEVDNGKVAELVSLGFEANAAVKALAKSHNDLSHACDILQSNNPEEQPGPSDKPKDEAMEQQ